MPLRPGPFTCALISLKLARLPGLPGRDEDDAYLILKDIIASYKCGVFANDEVVVLFAEPGEPPQLRPVKSLPEDARREIEDGTSLWRDGAVMLTGSATKRYLETSTLASARRLLGDWFTDNASPRSPGYATTGGGKRLLARDTAGTGQPNGQAVEAGRAAGQPDGQEQPQGPSNATPAKRRGPPGTLLEAVTENMLRDLQSGKRSLDDLEGDTLDALCMYGSSRNHAKAARKKARSEFGQGCSEFNY